MRILDLFERTEPDGDCVVWTGWRNQDGYGYTRHEGRDVGVHRLVFILSGIEIPRALEVDHLCRNPACLRPSHLELVTHAENIRRIRDRQTGCRRAGHDWTDPRNVYVRPNGRRWCAECARVDARERHRAA